MYRAKMNVSKFAAGRICNRLLTVIAAASLTVAPALADTIYKYVDKDGRVTYSSVPPAPGEAAGITELNVPGALPPEDVEAARKRAEDDARLAREMADERRKTDAAYERQRDAALQRELMERQLAATESPYVDPPAYGGSYYPPFWNYPPIVKPRPPMAPRPPQGSPGHRSSGGSFGAEPVGIPFRR